MNFGFKLHCQKKMIDEIIYTIYLFALSRQSLQLPWRPKQQSTTFAKIVFEKYQANKNTKIMLFREYCNAFAKFCSDDDGGSWFSITYPSFIWHVCDVLCINPYSFSFSWAANWSIGLKSGRFPSLLANNVVFCIGRITSISDRKLLSIISPFHFWFISTSVIITPSAGSAAQIFREIWELRRFSSNFRRNFIRVFHDVLTFWQSCCYNFWLLFMHISCGCTGITQNWLAFSKIPIILRVSSGTIPST